MHLLQESIGRDVSRSRQNDAKILSAENFSKTLQEELNAERNLVRIKDERIEHLEDELKQLRLEMNQINREKNQALLDAKRALSSGVRVIKSAEEAEHARKRAETERDAAHHRMEVAEEAQIEAERAANEAIAERDRFISRKADVDAQAADNERLRSDLHLAHVAQTDAEAARYTAQETALSMTAERDSAISARDTALREKEQLAVSLKHAIEELEKRERDLESLKCEGIAAREKERVDLEQAMDEARNLAIALSTAEAERESALAKKISAETDREALLEEKARIEDALKQKSGELESKIEELTALEKTMEAVQAAKDSVEISMRQAGQRMVSMREKLDAAISGGAATQGELDSLTERAVHAEHAQQELLLQLEAIKEASQKEKEEMKAKFEQMEAEIVTRAGESESKLKEAMEASAVLTAKLAAEIEEKLSCVRQLETAQQSYETAIQNAKDLQAESERLRELLFQKEEHNDEAMSASALKEKVEALQAELEEASRSRQNLAEEFEQETLTSSKLREINKKLVARLKASSA